jgi:hypothetical protein
MRKIVILARVSLVVILLLSIVEGCKKLDESGYLRFDVKEGLASFSFEYPSFFIEPIIDRISEPTYTAVKSMGTPPDEVGIEFLFLFVYRVSDLYPDSTAMLEEDLRRSQEILSDFRLLERSPITVLGNRGELITISYGGFTVFNATRQPETGTAHIAYFDHGGFVWEVELIADENTKALAKTHLMHILDSFKILD